jgi:hypothetical protein
MDWVMLFRVVVIVGVSAVLWFFLLEDRREHR